MYEKTSWKRGFTLAEILITLSIIGVIASMTIPSLVQDVQDAQLRTAWKKSYADVSQAARIIMLNNANNMKGALNGGHDVALGKFLEYFTYTKRCHSYDTTCGTEYCDYFKSAKLINGSLASAGNVGNCAGSGLAFAALNNGMFFYIDSAANGGNSATCTPYCARIVMDINGFKGPNVWGKDFYGAYVLKDSLKPFGTPGLTYENTCSTSGYGCGSEYLSK